MRVVGARCRRCWACGIHFICICFEILFCVHIFILSICQYGTNPVGKIDELLDGPQFSNVSSDQPINPVKADVLWPISKHRINVVVINSEMIIY